MPSLTTTAHQAPAAARTAESAAARLWLTGAEDFFARVADTTRDRETTGLLVTVACWPGVAFDYELWNDAIAALLTDAGLTVDDVHRLGCALNPHQPRMAEAFAALLDHPACTDAPVADLLARFVHVPAFGDYAPLAAAALAHGSLIPAGLTLTRGFGPLLRQQDDHRRAALNAADELGALCGPDLEVRRVLTALAEGWAGPLPDLVLAAAAVAA